MVGRSLSDEQVSAVRSAAVRADVQTAMRSLYADLDRCIALRDPVCRNRGACCRFGEYGHHLFVTTLEVAFFLATHGRQSLGGLEPLSVGGARSLACPFQRGGRCTAREGRPMGCRIFFCDPAMRDWQGPMTEEYLTRVRLLHEQLQVPYAYVEWLAALGAVGL